MATNGALLERELQCSICLDRYTNPTNTPCGHTFCKACLDGYWNSSDHQICPLCKESFLPQQLGLNLHVNHVLREVVESMPIRQLRAGDVFCHLCLGDRVRAVMSCLVCLTTYCQEHLRFHSARFTRHELMEPVANLTDRMCHKHERPLELFCRTHQRLCLLCTDHLRTGHEVVDMRVEYLIRKAMLNRTLANGKKRLDNALKALDCYNSSVRRSKDKVAGVIQQVESLSSDLINSAEHAPLPFVIEAMGKIREFGACFMKEAYSSIGDGVRRSRELREYVHSLMTRRVELELLVGTTDSFYFLKHFSLKECPTDLLAKPLSVFRQKLVHMHVLPFFSVERPSFQEHTVLTLDDSTAHPSIILFGEARSKISVDLDKTYERLRPRPYRFTNLPCILASQPITTSCYWEVVVDCADERRTSWFVGVASEEAVDHCWNSQFVWTLQCIAGRLTAGGMTPVEGEGLVGCWRIGVFHNIQNKTLAFHDMLRSRHLHTFSQVAGSRLFPVFCPDFGTGTGRSSVVMDVRRSS